MENFYDLSGKNVIITGAAGAIGKNIAVSFAAQGADLILIDIAEKKELLAQFAEELSGNYNIKAYDLYADIKNTQDIENVGRFIEEHDLRIDILINNAGVNELVPALEFSEESWDRIVDTDLKGAFFMSKMAGKNMMINDNKGCIINISSQHGVVGNTERAAYCAAKAGLVNLTRALSLEWANYGIRVNCISPTFVEHEYNKDYLSNPVNRRKYLKDIPLGRFAVPQDISNAALFLSCEASSLITGQNIVIDGGYTAK